MPVVVIRGDDALVSVSMGDSRLRSAPIWLLLIATIAFRLLDQFCNSSGGFVFRSHLGGEAACHRFESIFICSLPVTLWYRFRNRQAPPMPTCDHLDRVSVAVVVECS